jgi:hypothetical protein
MIRIGKLDNIDEYFKILLEDSGDIFVKLVDNYGDYLCTYADGSTYDTIDLIDGLWGAVRFDDFEPSFLNIIFNLSEHIVYSCSITDIEAIKDSIIIPK